MSTFPILYVADVDRAARFYEDAFGFERTYEWTEEGRVVYAAHKRGESRLAFGEGEGRGGFELCIYVDDVDATAARLCDLGASEVKAAPRTCPGVSGWRTSTTSTATGCT